jgi:hypothetical protein
MSSPARSSVVSTTSWLPIVSGATDASSSSVGAAAVQAAPDRSGLKGEDIRGQAQRSAVDALPGMLGGIPPGQTGDQSLPSLGYHSDEAGAARAAHPLVCPAGRHVEPASVHPSPPGCRGDVDVGAGIGRGSGLGERGHRPCGRRDARSSLAAGDGEPRWAVAGSTPKLALPTRQARDSRNRPFDSGGYLLWATVNHPVAVSASRLDAPPQTGRVVRRLLRPLLPSAAAQAAAPCSGDRRDSR